MLLSNDDDEATVEEHLGLSSLLLQRLSSHRRCFDSSFTFLSIICSSCRWFLFIIFLLQRLLQRLYPKKEKETNWFFFWVRLCSSGFSAENKTQITWKKTGWRVGLECYSITWETKDATRIAIKTLLQLFFKKKRESLESFVFVKRLPLSCLCVLCFSENAKLW